MRTKYHEFSKFVLKRTKKIVCVGFGKTGTTTFAKAMNCLGFNHKSQGHGFFFENKYYYLMLPTLWKFESFDDYPWPFLYKFIHRQFPSSKFILTTRIDTASWLNSLQRHYCRHGPSVNNKIFFGYYSPFENEKHLRGLYEGHNEAVRSFFRGNPNFLELCWERGDGWPELCGFLGKEVPETPFPHVNAATPEFDYEAAKLRADNSLRKILQSG